MSIVVDGDYEGRGPHRPAIGQQGAVAALATGPAPHGLRTKVVRPRLPHDYLVRPRLLHLLDRGLERPLTLLSAPGGFGKTTLLSAWQPHGHALAWLSLDEHDDDLFAFARAIVGAVQVAAPGVAARMLGSLRPAEPPWPSVLASRLADDMLDLPCALVVVLDDYHLIRSEAVHAFVGRLLARLPDHVHLVISGREDPPLPISTLRARAALVEIRLEQLAFTAEEARAFLSTSLAAPIDLDSAAHMARHTEGWAAGVRLAALAVSDASEGAVHASHLDERGAEYAREFLVEDVLAAQSDELQDLLLRVSIFGRFCAPLLDALYAQPSVAGRGDAWLATLKRANLFVVTVDADGRWCRLHPLFRDALSRRLQALHGAEHVAELHRRAGAWFLDRGMIDEAIEHALAAGDARGAARIVEERLHPLLDREDDPRRLERWLDLLPSEVTDDCPALLLARAWLLLLRNQPGEIRPLLRRAEELLDAEWTGEAAAREGLLGVAGVLWSYVWSAEGDADRALEAGDAAVSRVPPHWYAARGHAENRRAVALAMAGRGEEARDWLLARRSSATHADASRLGLVLRAEAQLDFRALRLGPLARTARELVALGQRHHLVASATWGHLYAGLARYAWNELEDARTHLLAAAARRTHADTEIALDSVLGLAVVLQAQGDVEAAWATLDDMSGRLTESDGPLRTLRSLQARFALDRGDLDEAGRRLRLVRGDGPTAFPSLVEIPEVTRARWLLLEGRQASLDEVGAIVGGWRRRAGSRPQPLDAAVADSVEALLLQARGDTEAALVRVQRVVSATRGGDALRWFVDLGSPMQRLLLELERWTSPPDAYVTRILAAFPATTGPLEAAAPSRRESHASIVDALTWRELEVLRLLDARMSNKEIARLLHISSETVKKHTGNIYQKLQVGSRREAVSRAHGLGLLRIMPRSHAADA